MEKAIYYFNNLACIIIILDSLISFLSIKSRYNSVMSTQKTPDSIPPKDIITTLILLLLTFITLPIAISYSYANYGFSHLTINKTIIDAILILLWLSQYKTFQSAIKKSSFTNYAIIYTIYNGTSIIALSLLMFPYIKMILPAASGRGITAWVEYWRTTLYKHRLAPWRI